MNTPTNTPQAYIGKHLIIDVWGGQNLENIEDLEKTLTRAAIAAGAVVLDIKLHLFPNGGITGVALLAESHISVHTWPELDYAAFDVFMCGDASPEKAVNVFENAFQPHTVKVREILRGTRA